MSIAEQSPTPTTPASVAPTPDADAVTSHWTGASLASPWLMEARALVPGLARNAEVLDRTGEFAAEAFEQLQDRRFMSMLVPAELGGGGATHAEAAAVLAELAHGCAATSLALSMHMHLVAAQVWRHHRGLPAPVLQKVAAKVVHAAIPFSADGVSIEETWDATGMRASGSHTVVLRDVFVPDAAVSLIRPVGEWHPVWGTVLGVAMPLIMATYVGVAESAVDRALELAQRRSERPEVATATGRMLNRLTTARDAVRAMIDESRDLRFANDLDVAARILSRKTAATDAAIGTVRAAFEVGGGAAYASGSGIGRLLRDVQGSLYHPLPTAQQERFTGRVALGLDPVG